MKRIEIYKTYKMYVNGAFIRSERGYVQPFMKENTVMANVPNASRKDLRNAVVVARKGFENWSTKTAFNRSQILYRFAEMLEDKRNFFEHRLMEWLSFTKNESKKELNTAIDLIFSYAGWADKYVQICSSVNPVATSFFNFTIPEPQGIVVLLPPTQDSFLGLIASLCPILVSGNASIVLLDNDCPPLGLTLAEVMHTSDFPYGSINFLSGKRTELLLHIGHHKDIDSIACYGASAEEKKLLQEASTENMKRLHFSEDYSAQPSIYEILPFIEFKTAWHPIGF